VYAYTEWAKKVAQSSNHHIDAIVHEKMKRFSPKCNFVFTHPVFLYMCVMSVTAGKLQYYYYYYYYYTSFQGQPG